MADVERLLDEIIQASKRDLRGFETYFLFLMHKDGGYLKIDLPLKTLRKSSQE